MIASKRERDVPAWLPVAAFLGWVFFVALRHIDDFDYWTHLALGRHFAEDWLHFLRSPLFAFSASNNEWPFQLMVYGVESLGSHPLVCVATALVATLFFVPLVWRASIGTSPAQRLILLLFLVWVVTVARFRFVPRPELLAYLLFTLGLWLVFSWLESPGKGKLFALMALLLAWFPLHPSLYIGAPLLLAVAIVMPGWDWWVRLWQGQKKRWVPGFALVLVALLLYEVGRFALRIYSYLTSGGVLVQVTEMRPTWEFPDLWWTYLVGVLLAFGLGALAPEGRWRRLFLLFLAFLPGLIVVRNVPLSLLFMAFVAIEGMRGWHPPQWLLGEQCLLLVLFILTLLGSGFYMANLPYPAWGPGVHWEYFPRQAADYVEEQHLPAPVFNNWDSGGYLNWRWQGTPRPFLDGRLGSKEIMADHDRIEEANGHNGILDRHGIRTILLRPFYFNNGRLLPVVRILLADRRWVLVDASDALVFVRVADLNGLTALPAAAGWQLVLRQADRLGRLDPNMRHLDFTRGVALLSLGRVDDARIAFKRGFEQAPELTEDYRMFKAL